MSWTMASPQLRIIESSRVAPPSGSVPEASLPLTFLDVGWLRLDVVVERVFFYRFPQPTSHFVDSAINDLKSSLSLILRHFYPLAGRIRRVPGHEDRHEIHYVDGDSVAFTVAECEDEDFVELSGNHAREVARLRALVPRLPRSADAQPLLTIQVTVFPGHGAIIGVTVHHAACDGSSSTQFLSSWAACCRSGGSAPVLLPLLDRTLIPEPRGLYSAFNKFSRIPEERSKEDAQEASGDNLIATFTFAGDQIKRLKELVLAKAATGGADATVHCSSITVAFAYVWVCLVKARGYEFERNCVLFFSTNGRSRLPLPVPAEYFGNCLGVCVVEAKASDLIGEDGFVVAAKAVGKSIQEFKNQTLQFAADGRPDEELLRLMSHQPLSVAGSPLFKVYDCDFGWGRPTKVEAVSIMWTGAMSMAESSAGGGGLEIGFVFPRHEMNEFTIHFNDGFHFLFERGML